MAEDSGAFKTNPVNSCQIPAFCNGPGAALQRSLTGQETFSGMPAGADVADF